LPGSQLQIESVVDQVYAAIRGRIEDGDLPRGTRLRQEALAEELGVSRTPLREALRRLAAEGFVRIRPNRGAEVVALTPGEVRAAYEARLVLEPGTARLAAMRRPADGIEAMRAAVRVQRGADGNRNGLVGSRDFHLALIRASGNEYLIRLGEALWVPGVAQAVYEQQEDSPELLLADAEEHARIANAVEAGDGDLAETLARRHIQDALGRLLGPGRPSL
jgi:DNA-binding GntR family transcriptional regulator